MYCLGWEHDNHGAGSRAIYCMAKQACKRLYFYGRTIQMSIISSCLVLLVSMQLEVESKVMAIAQEQPSMLESMR